MEKTSGERVVEIMLCICFILSIGVPAILAFIGKIEIAHIPLVAILIAPIILIGVFGGSGLVMVCFVMLVSIYNMIAGKESLTYKGCGGSQGTYSDYDRGSPESGVDYPASWRGPDDPGGSFDI